MDKSFKGNYIPFYTRLVKRLVPHFLLMLYVILKITYNKSFSDIRIYFYIVIGLAFIYGIYYQTDKIRTIVNEIKITDTTLHIIGQDFNAKYEDHLDLTKTMLEIQLEELGKNKTRFCLEIFSDEKYYYLNKFNDWKYETLVEIVDEFNLKTNNSATGMDLYSQLRDGK
ncbi:MAG: hypothetical protein RL311_1202 [Bacteroidota bacterium]|jgi:hypothetical protein